METPRVLVKALNRLQAIAVQQTALAEEQSQLQAFVATYELLDRHCDGDYPATAVPNDAPSPSKAAWGSAKTKILDAVKDILRDGAPRSTKQLVSELEQRGVLIGGADKTSNLSAILSREKLHFRNTRGQGYSLVPTPHHGKTEAADEATSAASRL